MKTQTETQTTDTAVETATATPVNPEYPIHPLCAIYEVMTEEELQELGENIQGTKLYNPITLFKDEGVVYILDGRCRYFACQKVGYRIPADMFRVFEGTKEEAIQFIMANNHERRHMTQNARIKAFWALTEELAKIAAERTRHNRDLVRQQKNGNQVQPEAGQKFQKGSAATIAAEAVHMAPGAAGRLIYVQHNASEATKKKLLEGKLTVNGAYEAAKKEVEASGKKAQAEAEKAKKAAETAEKAKQAEAKMSDIQKAQYVMKHGSEELQDRMVKGLPAAKAYEEAKAEVEAAKQPLHRVKPQPQPKDVDDDQQARWGTLLGDFLTAVKTVAAFNGHLDAMLNGYVSADQRGKFRTLLKNANDVLQVVGNGN